MSFYKLIFKKPESESYLLKDTWIDNQKNLYQISANYDKMKKIIERIYLSCQKKQRVEHYHSELF